MSNKILRKYNSYDRKKIVDKIQKLNNKNYYIDIYNIIIEELGNNFSSNSNGIFINLNILSDKCIDKINDYIISKNDKNINSETTETKIIIKTYDSDEPELTENGHKFSNQEKSIIRRFRKTQ